MHKTTFVPSHSVRRFLEAVQAKRVQHIFGLPGTKVDEIFSVLANGGPQLIVCTSRLPDAQDTAQDTSSAGNWVMALANYGPGTWPTSAVLPSLGDYAAAVQHNGLGHYQAAAAAAQRACDYDDRGLFVWALVELVEAAARSHQRDLASVAVGRLGEISHSCASDWALGIEARSRALLAESEEAEALYRAGIDWLSRTCIAIHLGRAHLVYGEWLRRENRRVDAREQLRRAHDVLSEIGATAFAGRAQGELLATCERVRKRTVDTFDELTAEETQIAYLARDGYTNPEIGARLFISPRTVEWHLRKVFAKLDISSRRELRSALSPLARPFSAIA